VDIDAPLEYTIAYEGRLNTLSEYSQAKLFFTPQTPPSLRTVWLGLKVKTTIVVRNPWGFEVGTATSPIQRVGLILSGWLYKVEEVGEGEPQARAVLAAPR